MGNNDNKVTWDIDAHQKFYAQFAQASIVGDKATAARLWNLVNHAQRNSRWRAKNKAWRMQNGR